MNSFSIHSGIGLMALAQLGLMAGLSGSFHCVGMCGGLSVASGGNFKDGLFYQMGRLMGYLFMASVVTITGREIINFFPKEVQLGLGVLLGLFLIFSGVQTMRGKTLHLPGPWAKAQFLFFRRFPKGSFFVGLASIFLPCGLLYSLLAALVVLQNPWTSMVFMLLFWLSSLPALTLIPYALRRSLTKLGIGWNVFNGTLFVLFGLGSIIYKFWPMGAQATSCH